MSLLPDFPDLPELPTSKVSAIAFITLEMLVVLYLLLRFEKDDNILWFVLGIIITSYVGMLIVLSLRRGGRRNKEEKNA